jgi:hypothetical protein
MAAVAVAWGVGLGLGEGTAAGGAVVWQAAMSEAITMTVMNRAMRAGV